MKRYLRYLISIFSWKKISYPDVSLFSYWDDNSTFTKYTKIGYGVRLLGSHIGKYTRISKNCSLLFTSIGNFSSLAGNIQLGAGRHPLSHASTSQLFYNTNSLFNKWVKPIDYKQNLPIKIGNDVWIGSNCFIKGGITIGDGVVIGTRSVVTKDIPPYAIVAGVPAKIIRYRFGPEVIAKLMEIKWWDFTDAKIDELIDFFREPDITLDVLNKYFPKTFEKELS